MNAPANPLTLEQSTSTNLTVVSDTLTELQKVEAGLAGLATRFAGVVYDVQTTKGMEQAKADRLEVREVRYSVQRAAKTAKDWLNEQKKTVDQKAEYIVEKVLEIEAPIDEQVKAEEQRRADEKAAREKAERERIEAIAKKLAEIRAQAIVPPGTAAIDIEFMLSNVKIFAKSATEAEFGDMLPAAVRAYDETLLKLKAQHTAAFEFEWQQAELARQREEQRIAAAAAAAAAKAEAERLNEQRKAEQEAFEAQRRAFEQQIAEQRAELERLNAATVAPVLVEKAVADANARAWIDTFAPDNGVCGSRPLADTSVEIEVVDEPSARAWMASLPAVEIVLEAAPEAPAVEEKATLKLGEIQRLLGLPIPSLLLADLGHPAADIPGTNAKLYKPSEFGAICRTLIAHIAKVAEEFEG